MARLRIVDVVPKHRWMVALDEVPHLGVNGFAIGLGLRLHRFIISGNADRTRDKCPVVAAGVVEAHAQTLSTDGSSQLANEVARRMLPFSWQFRVRRRTGPERKSIMMLRGEHDIFRASVVEYFSPGVRIPFLNLPVKHRNDVVETVVSATILSILAICRSS